MSLHGLRRVRAFLWQRKPRHFKIGDDAMRGPRAWMIPLGSSTWTAMDRDGALYEDH